MTLFVVNMLLVIFFLFTACNKDSSRIYSCDPRAQEYALINLEVNQDISRDSLANLPFEFQTAVFRSLTSENKLRIFREKIDLVLRDVHELNDSEIDALLDLRNNAPEEIYGKFDEDSQHPFLEAWENSIRNELGWNDTAISIYVASWNTPMELMNGFYSPSAPGAS